MKRERTRGKPLTGGAISMPFAHACAIRKQAHAKDVQCGRGMALPRTSQPLCEGSFSSVKSWLSSADPESCPQCPAPSLGGHH